MNKINELERLQNLKASGALSQEEFEIEKAKILKDNHKHIKLKWWQETIIMLFIVFVVIGIIANISNMQDKKSVEKYANSYTPSSTSKPKNTTQNITSNNTSTQTSTSTSLIGKHNIVYYMGLDISDDIGYLDLKSDNTFKLYFKSGSMELINIEGTYKISGNEITLNVTREGGFDISSQSRKEEVTIEKDNLSYYNNIKFAK